LAIPKLDILKKLYCVICKAMDYLDEDPLDFECDPPEPPVKKGCAVM
jgi:hypothetical protein